MASMKLVVGLGNPGDKYKNSRHNVGFMFVGFLVQNNLPQFVVKKSDSFMNDSGLSVKKILKKSNIEIENLYIVHDDLDISLGEFKIQFAKGPKVHNGIASIERELGTPEFWRIRIGVDARNPESRTLGEKYVLEDFSLEEKEILNEVFTKVLLQLKNGV